MHRLSRSATVIPLIFSLAVASSPALGAEAQPEDDELVLDDEDDDELVLDDEDDSEQSQSQVPPPRSTTSPAEAEANERLARQMYSDAESLLRAGRTAQAIKKYEAGYRLVPDKHGFAFKIGMAAWELRDCVKAQAMLDAFVANTEGEPKFTDRVNQARSRLAQIRDSGCADAQGGVVIDDTDDGAIEDEDGYEEEESPRERRRARRRAARMAADDENPLGLSSRDLRKSASRRADLRDRVEGGGLLGTGIAFMTLGVLGAGTGLIFNIMGHTTANELLELSKRDPAHKYPTGDWACRDGGETCPFDVQKKLNTFNIVTPIAYASGGAMFAVGFTLVLVRSVARKKLRKTDGDKTARRTRGPSLTGRTNRTSLADTLPYRPRPRLDSITPTFGVRPGQGIGAAARVRF